MKKLAIVATIMALGTGAALAASLNVPFFLDSTPPNLFFPPQQDVMFFVGLKNTSAGTITVTVAYQNDTGGDTTGAGSTTFSLDPGESISFRPHIADGLVDTPNSLGVARSTVEAGGAVFTWAGLTTDIQGRGVQIDSRGIGSFAFLLPPGV